MCAARNKKDRERDERLLFVLKFLSLFLKKKKANEWNRNQHVERDI
jgi:hypothetical protein